MTELLDRALDGLAGGVGLGVGVMLCRWTYLGVKAARRRAQVASRRRQRSAVVDRARRAARRR